MLKIKNLTKIKQDKILDDICLQFEECGMYLIHGPSGCGKTTLLQIIGKLDQGYDGVIEYYHQNIRNIKDYNHEIGFVFQQHQLIPYLNGLDNQNLASYFKKSKLIKKNKFIDFSLRKKISTYSGGQSQRISIMRNMVKDPSIILCDEPIASLNEENKIKVMKQLKELSKYKLIIVVSHDYKQFLNDYDGVIEMKDGKIIQQKPPIELKKEFLPKTKKIKRNILKIIVKQFCFDIKTNIKICFGVSIALSALLVTLSLSGGLYQQVEKYFLQLIPRQTIHVENKGLQDIDIETIKKISENDDFGYVEFDDYYQIGIYNQPTKNLDDLIYIGDMTKKSDDYKLVAGKHPSNENEIVLSSSLAKKLFATNDVKDGLNQTIYSYYQNQNNTKEVPLKVVGINQENTMIETMYLSEFANINHIESSFNIKLDYAQFFSLSLDDKENIAQQIQELKRNNPNLKFIDISKNITQNLHSTMEKVTLGLLIFCAMSCLAACFLIAQVLYLQVLHHRRNIGIIRCFFATKKDIAILTMGQSLVIVMLSFIQALINYMILIYSINCSTQSLVEGEFIQFNSKITIIVFIFALFLALISSYIPQKAAIKIDVIEALKSN